jgi:hypothetical protein
MEGKPGMRETISRSADHVRGGGADNSLLPMLIGGLIMIVVGAIIVMAFV